MKIFKKLLSFGTALLLSLASLLVFAPAVSHATAQDCTWTGATNNTFNTASNWSGCGGGVPQTGDNLIFDVTSLSTDPTIANDITSASFGTITFQGTNSNSHTFKITGNDMTLTGGIVANAYSTLDVNLTFGADVTISGTTGLLIGDGTTPATLDMNGHNLTFSAQYGYLFSVISGAGNLLVNGGPNSLWIGESNPSWTGTTTVTSSGSVLIFKANSLGANSNAVTIDSGSQLSFCALNGGTVHNPLTVGGNGSGFGALLTDKSCGGPSSASNSVANVTLAGAITLTANTKLYTVGTTTITGALNGNFTLGVAAGSPGTLVIKSSHNTSKTSNGSSEAPKQTFTVKSSDKSNTFVDVLKNQIYIIDGKRGQVDVNDGGILKGTGTVGPLFVFSGGIVAPGHSPGCLNTGNLTEAGTYAAEIGGTTACSGYDQLKVKGFVDLTGGTLSVSLYNNFKPKAGQKYTIISNDGKDKVTGTFKNLKEGATLKVSGDVFKITYKGGDGNDVVLSVISAPNTGFAQLTNSPALVAVASLFGALGIAFIARKFATQTVRR